MALIPGTRIGAYEVAARIGAGGMGEVYRATDTKLKRDVALKVLPASVAGDPERLARFQREAEVLASLNHPNIAHLYGIEDGSGTPALVMELVDGPTLADRIAQGAIPLPDALPIAKQIAEALEAAHERGIIHRDLKPANVKVRPDGTVKVLDFGLAKPMETGGSEGPHYGSSASMSPTITTPAMTAAGMILGTAAYMSPEQAKGRAADRRSDVWAFGAVLYEMLTGQRAFGGEDVSETLADVMRVEPAWDALPAGLSPSLTAFLKRCLEKDPRQRLADIHDMRLALDGAFDTASRPTIDPSGAAVARGPLWRRALPLAATVLVVAAAAWLAGRLSVPSQPRPVIRASGIVPQITFSPIGLQVLDVSHDGRYIAYCATNGGAIYLRARDELEDRAIRVQGLPSMPMMSPDGQSLAYYDAIDRNFKRVGINGGPARALTAKGTEIPYGGSWGADGAILYGLSDGVWEVPENGGDPRRIFAAEAGERIFGPSRLPGGDWILFTALEGSGTWDTANIVVASPSTGERRVIVQGGRDAHYVPTGHLVYMVSNVLYVVPFDAGRHIASGEPVPVVEGIAGVAGVRSYAGASYFAVSPDGTLAYIPGGGSPGQTGVLAWTGLDGRQERLDLPAGDYNSPRISPDGRWLAFERLQGATTDVWLYEIGGTTAIRLLTEGGNNEYPVWTRDSQYVVFQSDREGDKGIFRQRVDGTEPAERLTTAEPGAEHVPEAWSRTEDRLAFSVRTDSTTQLWMWTAADRTARRFGDIESSGLFNAAFSPDGRWIAYTERSAGARIYIALVAAPETHYLLGQNTEQNHHPLWSPTEPTRLYFFSNVTPMAVDVTTRPSLSQGRPTELRNLPINVSPQSELNHDVAPDGSRFITFVPGGLNVSGQVSTADSWKIVVVYNWFEELKRLAPATRTAAP